MRGRLEVLRLRRRLDETFARVDRIEDLEAKSDFARYLCVLVSGFVERSCIELALEWSRNQASPSVLRYVSGRLAGFQNPKRERVIELVRSFDPDWADLAEDFIVDARATALDAVVARRHQIAHGENAGISYAQIADYYREINDVVDFLTSLFDPA